MPWIINMYSNKWNERKLWYWFSPVNCHLLIQRMFCAWVWRWSLCLEVGRQFYLSSLWILLWAKLKQIYCVTRVIVGKGYWDKQLCGKSKHSAATKLRVKNKPKMPLMCRMYWKTLKQRGQLWCPHF